MRVQVVDNVDRRMDSVLLPIIEQSQDIRVAVAFVSRSGLSMIDASLQTALQAGAHLEFLVGLDMGTTEPDALTSLYELSRTAESVSLYCYAAITPQGIYHPKLYLLRTGNEATSIIGSSNLTAGGLRKNVEVNVVLEGNILDNAISDSYTTYYRLKFHPNRVVPDDEYIALYGELRRLERKRQTSIVHDGSLKELVGRFDSKAKSLKSPKMTSRDLVGWPKLVYDALPASTFTNEEIYVHGQTFQARYPENKHTKAKIRQQLQILRDMKLIEHIEEGLWRKL